MIISNILCTHSLSLSEAAVNPDVCTQVALLWPPACRVPGVLSAVRDVRQQTGMARPGGPGPCWTGSAVSGTDRHVAVISPWQAVSEPPRGHQTAAAPPPVIPPDCWQRGRAGFSTWHHLPCFTVRPLCHLIFGTVFSVMARRPCYVFNLNVPKRWIQFDCFACLEMCDPRADILKQTSPTRGGDANLSNDIIAIL